MENPCAAGTIENIVLTTIENIVLTLHIKRNGDEQQESTMLLSLLKSKLKTNHRNTKN